MIWSRCWWSISVSKAMLFVCNWFDRVIMGPKSVIIRWELYKNNEVYLNASVVQPHIYEQTTTTGLWINEIRRKVFTYIALNKFNVKRRNLLKWMMVIISILDTSMLSWRPKPSNLGTISNYPWSKIIIPPWNCIMQLRQNFDWDYYLWRYYTHTEPQINIKHITISHPWSFPYPTYTAEVVYTTKWSGIVDIWWAGGNTWFSSVITAVEI